MTLGAQNDTDLKAHQLELLTAIGQQIGMALENARLYQDSEDWAEELTRLQRASSNLSASIRIDQVTAEIAHQSAWLLKCQKACVIHLNGPTGQIALAAGFGLSQSELQLLHDQLPKWNLFKNQADQPRTFSFRNGSTENDLPDELVDWLNSHSVLVVPIWTSETPQDYVLLLDVNLTRQWRPRELELIESLVYRAAVALVNANLHNQLELAAALEERQRIAANMHDGLAQTLSLLGLRVDRMQELVEGESDEVETAVGAMRDAVSLALIEVRRSIATLQEAPRVRNSLQDLLHDLVEQSRSADRPELQLDLGAVEMLYISPEQAEQVLRIIQESILNACRHAQAQSVQVHLEKSDSRIKITIEDDGCGFDLNAPRQTSDHFGLSIMQARAARIGSDFQIDTSPGNGTRISLTWTPE